MDLFAGQHSAVERASGSKEAKDQQSGTASFKNRDTASNTSRSQGLVRHRASLLIYSVLTISTDIRQGGGIWH